MSGDTGKVWIGTGVSAETHKRLLELARARGFVHKRSGRPNEARIVRELLGLGLQVAEGQAGPVYGR